jgi:hypothetical protein
MARLDCYQLEGQAEFLPAGKCWKNIEELQMRMAQLEKRLQEASKAREQRLRRAPIEFRASMAFEMQDMDQEVLSLGRELAMRTLDVQLDYLYVALEDELLEVRRCDVPSSMTFACSQVCIINWHQNERAKERKPFGISL